MKRYSILFLFLCIPCVFAVTMTPVFESGSPIYAAGTSYNGFTSQSSNALAPFSGTSIHFKGTYEGGTGLVFRYRLTFDALVELTSLVFQGAAWNGVNDNIKLYNSSNTLIKQISATGSNAFQINTMTLAPGQAIGTTFFIQEDTEESSTWRYRSSIAVNYIPVPEAGTISMLFLGLFLAFPFFKKF